METRNRKRSSEIHGGEEWTHFPHGADIGIEGKGPTVSKAFEQAAFALTAAVTNAAVNPEIALEIDCEAPNKELLFVEWLNSIIYEMSTRNMIFGRFKVGIAGNHLHGRLWGECVDRKRHEPASEPKGATFTELKVAPKKGVWTARCVVDV